MSDTENVSHVKSISQSSQQRLVVSMVINGNKFPDKERNGERDGKKNRSLAIVMGTSLLGMLYAIVLVLFGIIFPISEALQATWLQTDYNGAFLVYIYTVGTAFLLHLLCYVIPMSKKRKRQREQEQTQSSMVPVSDTTQHGTLASFKDKIWPFHVTDRRSSVISNHVDTSNVMNETSASISSLMITSDGNKGTSPALVNLDGLKEIFTSEGSSFYLRLGTMIFGIGNMIYVALEIDFHMIDVSHNCNPAKYGFTYIFRLIFTIVQTFFIFKVSKIDISVHMNIVRVGFMHLIAANLCIWIRTLINEILNEFHHEGLIPVPTTPPYNETVSSNIHGHAEIDDCVEDRDLIKNLSPYLFPFVLEYSLISTGIFAIMASEIRHSDDYLIMHNLHHMLKMQAKQKNPKNVPLSKIKEAPASDPEALDYAGPMHTHRGEISLANSNKGLFCGILLLTGMIVSITLFLQEKEDSVEGRMIYLITDICLHFCLLIANLMGMYFLSKLPLSHKPFSVDDILIMVSMSGSFLLELSIIVSTAVYISEGSLEVNQSLSSTASSIPQDKHDIVTILALCCSVLAAIQSIVQVVLIIGGLRCYSISEKGNNNGRQAITFLIVANVTVWIYRTIQVKELELGIQEEFYGTLAWLFILNLNLPLLLFFRFHSSVCFADIWNTAFTPVDHSKPIFSPQTPEIVDTHSEIGSIGSLVSHVSGELKSHDNGSKNPIFFLEESEEIPMDTIHL